MVEIQNSCKMCAFPLLTVEIKSQSSELIIWSKCYKNIRPNIIIHFFLQFPDILLVSRQESEHHMGSWFGPTYGLILRKSLW
jgi:hypothetical protein